MDFAAKIQSFWKTCFKFDLKIVSQSILEVGQFTFRCTCKKLLNSSIIIKMSQIYYRIPCIKKYGFEKTPLFYMNVQLLQSIVRRFFIDFGKLVSKMIVFLLESSFLPSKACFTALFGEPRSPYGEWKFFFLRSDNDRYQVADSSELSLELFTLGHQWN